MFVPTAGSWGTGVRPSAAAAPGDDRSRVAPEVRITRPLGEQRLPHKMQFAGTTVGGLSGFDLDRRTGTWYFVSDDRWRYDPARFYTGRMDFDPVSGAFDGVRMTGVTTLRRPDGSPFPAYGKPESVDPETIRFDRWSRRLLWGQEGDRPDAGNPTIPLSPMSVRWIDRAGRPLGELRLPGNLALTGTGRGPRRNLGIEGLTFARSTIAAAVETARYEDGEPSTVRRGGPTRITVWGREGRLRGQYAYPVDPLPQAPNPPSGMSDGGVSEILAIDDHRYLALERFWLQGVGYKVKLYEFDLSGATNVLSRDSLATGTAYRPVVKHLVSDLGAIRPPAQNFEGLAWGPRLATGECALVIGADDNFDQGEIGQFLAFAVSGVPPETC